jgi:hypothetical protein
LANQLDSIEQVLSLHLGKRLSQNHTKSADFGAQLSVGAVGGEGHPVHSGKG